MNQNRKYLLLFLVFCLFLGFALANRSFLMANIIEPIALFFWAGWRIIISVNQNVYWAILIVFSFILLIRFVPVGYSTSSKPSYNYTYKTKSRVEYWQLRINDAWMGKDGAKYLRDDLKNLLAASITHEDQRAPSNAKASSTLVKGALPVSIQAFLFSPKEKRKMFSGDYSQLLLLTPKFLRGWVGKFIQPDTALIDETLKWIESSLEIRHDQ